jgi:phosphohistidine swiveling domain-containing protein
VEKATEIIRNGTMVTLDVSKGEIYSGSPVRRQEMALR